MSASCAVRRSFGKVRTTAIADLLRQQCRNLTGRCPPTAPSHASAATNRTAPPPYLTGRRDPLIQGCRRHLRPPRPRPSETRAPFPLRPRIQNPLRRADAAFRPRRLGPDRDREPPLEMQIPLDAHAKGQPDRRHLAQRPGAQFRVYWRDRRSRAQKDCIARSSRSGNSQLRSGPSFRPGRTVRPSAPCQQGRGSCRPPVSGKKWNRACPDLIGCGSFRRVGNAFEAAPGASPGGLFFCRDAPLSARIRAFL